MMTEREIFLEALELPTPEARVVYLQEACGPDVTLRQKVDGLLREHFSNDSLLAGSALGENQGRIVESPGEEPPAQIIGRHKLLEKIGEGGFGEVWMAEQREPVKRRVALKIIKLGMDSRQIVGRFEAERQALAMMDHPNIAKILDAGTTQEGIVENAECRIPPAQATGSETDPFQLATHNPTHHSPLSPGRPYFVMELVRGLKITDYCDQNQLPTQDRLRLFILVCQAIQHAHQKGIIHRDIKPSNVLVTLHDGVPVPKVIDFGIAKATQVELTARTVFTQFQQFIGTPAYISPEQAEMSGLDIDTRADIYSLGVLLYELLVGQTPFDPEEMMKGGLDALRQIIREKEPVRPSTRLTQLQALARDSKTITRHSSLATDLDWIVMKCLEKDRTRRYETANGLAMDLRRHLVNEPVSARPPSQLYRLQRFAQRNRAAALATVVIVCASMLGLSISIVALLSERRAHRVADDALAVADQQRQSAEAAREHAERNALTARRNAYAADMFAAHQAFDMGNLGRARDLLQAHWSSPDEPDLRGFEWRYLWNLCQGDHFHTLAGHSNFVSCVAFSPDGQWLATGSADASVKVWDVTKRKLAATLPAHARRVHWLGFSPDGETLATAGDDELKLWNANTHHLTFTLKEPGIARFAFSPIESVVAIGYGDPVYAGRARGSLKLWNYVTRQVLKTFPDAGSRLAFSPDGKMLAAYSANDAVRLWSVASGLELRTLPGAGEVLCLGFSPDGKSLATGNWGGEVVLWKVDTGERVLVISGYHGQIWSLAFSPDGKLLATGSSDQSLRLWNVATGKEEVKLIGHGNEVWAVAFAPDGRTLATGGKDERVMLWSTAPKRAEVILTNVHLAPSFSRDSRLLAVAELGGPVTVWNVANRQPVWVLESEEFAHFSDEGETLSTISTNHVLRFWDVPTQTLRHAVPLTGLTDSTQECRFAIQGNRLAAVDDASLIRLYDTRTGHMIGKFRTWRKSIGWRHAEGLKFSPDARLLATAGSNDTVKLWDVETQTEWNSLRGHKEPAQGLAFSPDGSLVASASYDGHVRFLRIATGELEAPLSGIKEGCSGVAFSPDGQTLSVACEDGTVRLWDVATKREVAVLKHGKAPVRLATFSFDSQTLVSVCEDGTLRLWHAPNPEVPRAQIGN